MLEHEWILPVCVLLKACLLSAFGLYIFFNVQLT